MTELTLPPDIIRLSSLCPGGKSVYVMLVLSEPPSRQPWRQTLAALRNRGVTIVTFPLAQEEVSIPDPGLNAAIREALEKPNGPLTEQDLLSLTNLNASNRNVKADRWAGSGS